MCPSSNSWKTRLCDFLVFENLCPGHRLHQDIIGLRKIKAEEGAAYPAPYATSPAHRWCHSPIPYACESVRQHLYLHLCILPGGCIRDQGSQCQGSVVRLPSACSQVHPEFFLWLCDEERLSLALHGDGGHCMLYGGNDHHPLEGNYWTGEWLLLTGHTRDWAVEQRLLTCCKQILNQVEA